MSWRAITETDVQSCMNSAEDHAARNQYLSFQQTDPLPEVITQVTADIREAIRSNPENTLPEDETLLPASAIRHAAVIIRHGLLGRFGVSISEGRMKEWDAAQKYLEKLEDGSRKVAVDGVGGESAKPPMTAPAVNQSPRRDGWRDQNGI